jgi:hypothetical protein
MQTQLVENVSTNAWVDSLILESFKVDPVSATKLFEKLRLNYPQFETQKELLAALTLADWEEIPCSALSLFKETVCYQTINSSLVPIPILVAVKSRQGWFLKGIR